ncbi:MAG: glycosyltransferase family 4 protein [Pseudomonadota bacterium]
MSTDRKASSRRIIFVNRFYYPDHSATAQILADVAEHLARTQDGVEVITSRLSYDGAAQPFKPRETTKNVRIRRVSTTRFGRAHLVGRAVDYASFYLSASAVVFRRARRGDVLVIKTDPPLLSIPLGLIGRLKGMRVLNWLQDIYPDVASSLGLRMFDGPIGALLKGLRDRSFRKAARNIVIGDQMAERLLGANVPAGKIATIHNFVDDVAIQPLAKDDNALRRAWGFEPTDFIVGYSGNLGRAHDLDTMLGAAALVSDTPSIKFLFVGGGHLRERLDAEIEARGLTNVVLKPYQPRDQLPLSLGVPDAHWVSLLPSLEGLIVPSKLYGIAAAGRPLLMIGYPDGEIGSAVRKYGFGVGISPGEAAQVAHHISEWASTPAKVAEMSTAARRYVDEKASRQRAFEAWSELISAGDGR